jgi:hypothetical protein
MILVPNAERSAVALKACVRLDSSIPQHIALTKVRATSIPLIARLKPSPGRANSAS